MKDWRAYDPRKVEDDEELIFDHSIIHSWWNNPKLRPEGITEEDLKKLHDEIVEEMKRRGIEHHTPLELEKPYAAVHSFREKSLGKEIELSDVLKWYEKPIVLAKDFVCLVGGLSERGKTDGDIDLLIKWPESVPDEVVHPVRFRLGRALPKELAERVQFLLDKYHGPFTSYVPLYDLVLMPSNRELVAMSVSEIKGILDEHTRAVYLDHMDINNVQTLVVPFAGTGLFIYDAMKRNPNLVVYANDFASWSRVCVKSLLMGVEEDISHVKKKYGLEGFPNYAVILALVKWFNEGKNGDLREYAEYFKERYKPLNSKNIRFFQLDAREFAKKVSGDVAFVNPPKMTRRGETLWKKFDELDSIIDGEPVKREHDVDLDSLLAEVINNLHVKTVYVNVVKGTKPSVSKFSTIEVVQVGRDTLYMIKKEETQETPEVVLATLCGKTKADIELGYPHELWIEKDEVREIHQTGLPYAIISFRYGFAWWDTKYPYYDEWNNENIQMLIENAKKAMRPGVRAVIVYLKSFPHGRRIVHELQKALPDVEFYVATNLKQALELYEKLKGDGIDLKQQKLFELRAAEEEAKQSKEENRIEPLRFFYPLKATKGYHEGEVYNLEQILAWFKYPEDYPLVLQKKYDGLRIIWSKKGDTVYAWTDDGTRCEDRFPSLVKMLKELPVEEIVLDSETEGWSGKEHWGREITAGYARAHDQPADDANFVVNVFDVLYVDGLPKHHELDVHGDLHEQPYEVRLRVLDYIGALAGWQSTDEVPKTPGFNVVKSYWLEKPDVEKLEKLLEHIKNLPGSEGAMIKSAKSDYPLTGHTNLWLKYKKSADVHAVVIERLPTKTEGVYRYRVGLLLPSGWEAPEDEVAEITLKNGKKVKVLDVGKTFNTDKKLEQGDIVTVMFHTLFVYDDGRVKLYEPKLYEVRPEQVIPDTVTDAIKIAEQAGLVQKKMVGLSKLRYGMQFHFRGGSVHADLRIEKPDGSALQGWTLAIQEEDLFEKEVMKHWKVEKDGQLRKVYWDEELYYVYDMKKDEVLEWNSRLDDKILQWHKDAVWKHPEWWKIDLKTGRPRERQPGEGVDSKRPVVEKIWATKKQDEPVEWLDVEGVYPPREIEPVPGGTRFWPGVFVRVDSGTVEYGAQKSYFKEYFFSGKVLKGRYVLRLVNRNGELIWLFWKTDDETPYVISKRAVETGWMPPLGESALPEEWEKKVPKELRWWEAKDVKEARRRRDEFVKQLKLESDRFLLQYQWWKGPVVIRRGPSEDRYYLRVIRRDGVTEIEMDGDPRREHVPGIVRDVEYDEFWDIGEGTVIDIPPGSEYNPTKATPSWLMTLESGKAKVLQEDPLVLKIDLGENRTFIAVRSSPDEDVWECWIDYASPGVKR